ncbi:hypothetical protein [Microbispora sp. ATCC PTA-5024]|nr:hypothetical protein [Microbispora sp. ATCC PTA-5024]ETK36173.1 hypothetical protein MPTA5024_11140 [Microbispora sp. ATCC PTA-5024]
MIPVEDLPPSACPYCRHTHPKDAECVTDARDQSRPDDEETPDE